MKRTRWIHVLGALIFGGMTPAAAQVKYADDYTAVHSSQFTPTFRFVHANSHLSLDPHSQGNRDDKRTTTVWEYQPGDDAFRWVVVPQDPDKASSRFGSPVSVDDLTIGDGTWYYIVNARNGLALTHDSTSKNVSSWGLLERGHRHSDHQLWKFEVGSNEQSQGNPYVDGDYVTIINKMAGEYLAQHDGGTRNDKRNVHVWGSYPQRRDHKGFWWKLVRDRPLQLYKLTIEKIRCIHPSTGQDAWTKVLFAGIDLALEGAKGAMTGGASAAGSVANVSRRQIVEAAKKSAKDAVKDSARGIPGDAAKEAAIDNLAPAAVQDALAMADILSISSEKIFNDVYGASPDALNIAVNGTSIWPNGGRQHRDTRSQQVHAPNTLEYIFRPSHGLKIQLIEWDYGSNDDDLGSLTWNPPYEVLAAPVRFEDMMVRKASEGSLYELTFTIESLSAVLLERPTMEIAAIQFAGMSISVDWHSFAVGNGLLTLARADAAEFDYLRAEPIRSVAGDHTFDLESGPKLPPGDYEVRLYDQKGDAILATKQPFKVIAGPAIQIVGIQYTGTTIIVDWDSLEGGNALLTVARAGAPELDYLRAERIRGAAGRHVFGLDSGPKLPPGDYEARLYDQETNGALATKQSFKVLPAPSAQQLAETDKAAQRQAAQQQAAQQQAAQQQAAQQQAAQQQAAQQQAAQQQAAQQQAARQQAARQQAAQQQAAQQQAAQQQAAQQQAAQQQAAQQQAAQQQAAQQQAAQQQAAQQLVRQATGTGEVNQADETQGAVFELWGSDGQTTLIRMEVGGQLYEIAINDSDNDTEASGLLTPCDDGVCRCEMGGDEREGRVWGSCDNNAHPEYGKMSFTVQLN